MQAGILLDCGDGLLLSASTFRTLCQELQQLFGIAEEQTASEIKDRWQVTRKHAIPFLEYCDLMQVTRRDGNVRKAGPELERFANG